VLQSLAAFASEILIMRIPNETLCLPLSTFISICSDPEWL
jgi:hypothetical protein